MKPFAHAHATHPQWRMAAALVLAQLRAQLARDEGSEPPSLGLLYITDHYAAHAQDILDHLGAELPEVTDWAGTVGVGICATQVEYLDEPALALMLCRLSPDQYRVFSGVAPLAASLGQGFVPQTALVHADPSTPELGELIAELADRTASGCVFGGLPSSRAAAVQFARSSRGAVPGMGRAGAAGVFEGGISGVAFGAGVGLVSRVTQGASPVSPWREVTAAREHRILTLDHQPALDVLLQDLGLSLDEPQPALLRLRQTLVGLVRPGGSAGRPARAMGEDVLVRHLVGLDMAERAFAVAETVSAGTRLAFCERHVEAARADLMRIGAEIREALEPEEWPLTEAALGGPAAALEAGAPEPARARQMLGAVYVSCTGRGGAHFGAAHAELQILRRALGEVPLVGFFAAGEIAHHRLHGYTGVLTVFTG